MSEMFLLPLLRPLRGRIFAVSMALAACFFTQTPVRAEDAEAVRALLVRGEYAQVIRLAEAGVTASTSDPEWPLLLGEALGKIGRYADARTALLGAVEKFPYVLRVRFAAWEALRNVGAIPEANRELARLAGMWNRGFGGSADRIASGRVALLLGADPKVVLAEFFDPVRKAQPEFREAYLATGELALGKSDFALAAKTFLGAVKRFPQDPDVWFGLARAYAPSDAEKAGEALKKVLQFNPQHAGAYLLLAERAIDAESYAEAEKALAVALKINPLSPEAHACRAVLANLRADEAAEKSARAAALKTWPTNPAVPHLIGRKLAQKYRFAEGAALQREALKFDPAFLPAKAELANDLLRLGGHDDEAWQLANEVQQADPYDVVAFNLTTLHDAIAHFRTLSSEHFTVKMDPKEAAVYGPDVLALLERAHATITKKYGLQLRDRTIVEIFPDQKDFAIRTFGLPGGAGYLGVCFGRVITANSPAARPGSTANWEAVLWHEFTHVVTLTLTKNKMPRWLSEGISVSEERQARGNWGEQMKPRYRAMILSEDLVPLSQLSASFLRPKSPAHLGFAYYESSLAVEWLTERWGLEKVKRLLADLARGTEINAALAAHFAPMEKLDADFATHARDLAKATGPKLDWSTPPSGELASARQVEDFLAQHPENYLALLEQAKQLLEAKQWTQAKGPLEKLIALYPRPSEGGNAYALLAQVHRELGETDAEIAMLNQVAELNSDAVEAYARLMQLAAQRQDWRCVVANAGRFSAVNPLSPQPHRAAAEAHEALGERPAAIAAYRTLLALAPPVPSEIHYRLGRLLHAAGDPAAKREVLLALEESPRFRAALELLLQIAEGK